MPWLNRRSLCLLAALASPPVGVSGQQPRTSEPPVDVVEGWIDELGSESFQTRQASQRRLLELSGRDAVQSRRVRELLLATTFPSDDLELDLAKRRLLRSIDARQAELQKDRFLHDPEFDRDSIPGWQQFSQVAGTGMDARLAFAAILGQHPAFGHAISGETFSAAGGAKSTDDPLGRPDTTTWFAVLAMACRQPHPRADEHTLHMVSLLRAPGAGPDPIHDYERSVCSRLIAEYLSRGSIDPRDRLVIATRYDCRAVVETECRRVLADVSQSPSRIVTALLAASAVELPTEELREWTHRYRDDSRVSHVWRSMVPPKTTLRTQVRDVALAVELHRSGVDPRSRGFAALVADPILIYRPYSLGFESEAERAKTHRPPSAIR